MLFTAASLRRPSMNKRRILFSLPLLVLIIPSYISGQSGLLFPLLWLAALLLTPFFTAPLLAGETARGTDIHILTQPLTDKEIILRLYRKGISAFLPYFLLPLCGGSLALLFMGIDVGTIFVSMLTMGGGILLFTSVGLAVSLYCGRIVSAWLLTYALLLPLNFLNPFFPRWTDPLFTGYVPFAALFLWIGALTLCFGMGIALLAFRREEESRKKKLIFPGLIISVMILLSLLPGGMDLTLAGDIRVNRVTVKEIRSLSDPLYIRWYRTSNYEKYGSGMKGVDAFLASLRMKGGLALRYSLVNLSDEEIIERGEEKGWTVQTVESGDDFEPFYSALEIEYHGKVETLPLLYNPLVGEEQLLAALQRLTTGRIPSVGVIIGRSDRRTEDFWSILKGALGEYFKVTDYTEAEDSLSDNPPDALFVLGGRDLSAWEVSRIFTYVEEGGSALVTLSPFELDPVNTDIIFPAQETPLALDLERMGIWTGDSFITDPDRGLFLPSGNDSPPDFYPLWFNTGQKNLYDYNALWSAPLYYTGHEPLLWSVESSASSFLALSLSDLTPESLYSAGKGGEAAYYTCIALSYGKGKLVVLSGEESLSNLMVLADKNMSNSAWSQTIAFFLTGNEDLLEYRRKSLGRRK
jgi:hypothetical protein